MRGKRVTGSEASCRRRSHAGRALVACLALVVLGGACSSDADTSAGSSDDPGTVSSDGGTPQQTDLKSLDAGAIPSDAGQVPDSTGDENIIGGQPVEIASLPWTVALVRPSGQEGSLQNFCGGVLISPAVVMTAAHCVTPRPPAAVVPSDPANVEVVLGRSNLDETTGERIAVQKVYVSKRYADNNRDGGDYALLLLAQDSKQKPISLPRPSETDLWADGTPLVAAGWGCEFVNTPTTTPCERAGRSPLKWALMAVEPASTCDAQLDATIDRTIDRETEICAKGDGSAEGTCNGDSGGPLITLSEDTWFLVGLVSWGVVGCSPTIAEVEAFVPAITAETGERFIDLDEIWYVNG